MKAALFVIALVALSGCKAAAEAASDPNTDSPSEQPASSQPSAIPPAPSPKPSTGVQETVSGLRSVVLRAGSGMRHPESHDRVRIRFEARTRDGRVFDSTLAKNRPRTFAVSDLFFGWSEGVRLMVEGERRRLWIPEPLVIDGRRPAPWPVPSGDLVIDVDLEQIEAGVAPPQTPEQLSPPATAQRTPSGLAYQQLAQGHGSRRPSATDRVRIEYSGWTSSGVMFRSTYGHGPTKLRVTDLISGWAEGLQLMVEGEKTRLWIPEALAYEGQSGQPAGMLILDVHLVEILPARSDPQ